MFREHSLVSIEREIGKEMSEDKRKIEQGLWAMDDIGTWERWRDNGQGSVTRNKAACPWLPRRLLLEKFIGLCFAWSFLSVLLRCSFVL